MTKSQIIGFSPDSLHSSVSLRFQIPLKSVKIKSPLFGDFLDFYWLGMRDSNPRCRIQSPEPYHLANSQYNTYMSFFLTLQDSHPRIPDCRVLCLTTWRIPNIILICHSFLRYRIRTPNAGLPSPAPYHLAN